jgi:hypothetical protein
MRNRFRVVSHLENKQEDGAILILALVFLVATSLLVLGLASWEGNDINNVGTLKSARSETYAASGAIQAAITTTRYTYPASTTPGICERFNSVGYPSVDVWCTYPSCPLTVPFCTRAENMAAYPSGQCSSTPCTGNPYVNAEVLFDDYSSLNYSDCAPSQAQTTCGSSMAIYSYIASVNSS